MEKRVILSLDSAKDSAELIYCLAGKIEESEKEGRTEEGIAIHAALIDAYIALMSLKEDIVREIPEEIIENLVASQEAKEVTE